MSLSGILIDKHLFVHVPKGQSSSQIERIKTKYMNMSESWEQCWKGKLLNNIQNVITFLYILNMQNNTSAYIYGIYTYAVEI